MSKNEIFIGIVIYLFVVIAGMIIEENINKMKKMRIIQNLPPLRWMYHTNIHLRKFRVFLGISTFSFVTILAIYLMATYGLIGRGIVTVLLCAWLCITLLLILLYLLRRCVGCGKRLEGRIVLEQDLESAYHLPCHWYENSETLFTCYVCNYEQLIGTTWNTQIPSLKYKYFYCSMCAHTYNACPRCRTRQWGSAWLIKS